MKDKKFKFWQSQELMSKIYTIDELIYSVCLGKAPEQVSYTNYITLQFTGLKDKNWVEIYEWDIIKFTDIWVIEMINDEPVTEWIWKVEYWIMWNTNYWVWILNKVVTDFRAMSNSFLNIEVIWNIYENPNLIDNKKQW